MVCYLSCLRNYLHIVFGTTARFLQLVSASDVYRYEGGRFECLPDMGHDVNVLAKPRSHIPPQKLRHHLDRDAGGDTRQFLVLVNDRSERLKTKLMFRCLRIDVDGKTRHNHKHPWAAHQLYAESRLYMPTESWVLRR